jgi:hypothetical protein
MHAAVKLQVTIDKDRLVQLPDDLPEGRAEIIVLYPETTPASRPRAAAASAKSKRPSYFARLAAHQPVPLSAQASRALDEADRGER